MKENAGQRHKMFSTSVSYSTNSHQVSSQQRSPARNQDTHNTHQRYEEEPTNRASPPNGNNACSTRNRLQLRIPPRASPAAVLRAVSQNGHTCVSGVLRHSKTPLNARLNARRSRLLNGVWRCTQNGKGARVLKVKLGTWLNRQFQRNRSAQRRQCRSTMST